MINYFQDGPCGDCPSKFTCVAESCIHWQAWLEVQEFILNSLCAELGL